MDRIPSEYDQRCIKKLKELGFFTHIKPEKFEGIGKGAIIVLCADGDQFVDVHGHITGLCNERVQSRCIHTLALNGGALLMNNSGKLPQKQARHGDILFENVLEASEIKKVNDIFLYSHFPCAVAGGNGMGVVDQGEGLMAAKQRLKQANPNFRISCFFHVYEAVEGVPKRRTYFLPKESWQNPEHFISALHEVQACCRG